MNNIKLLSVLIFSALSLSQVQIKAENIVVDEFAEQLPNLTPYNLQYSNYNFESMEKIPIKMQILEDIRSEEDLYEGQIVKFELSEDVKYNGNIILKKGAIVDSKVSVIITSGMNGIPASIIFSDFKIDNIKSSRLDNTYERVGQDRSLLVFPLKWALTPLPPTGTLTNFIKGGHAKLKHKNIITLYYYPKWN